MIGISKLDDPIWIYNFGKLLKKIRFSFDLESSPLFSYQLALFKGLIV